MHGFRIALGLAMSGLCAPAAASGDAGYLQPQIAVGEHFSNVFSIAVAIDAVGYDSLVRRNGGTADYTLKLPAANQAFTFDSRDLYDGLPGGEAENIIRDGGATSCWKGECRTYTDASGLLYNQLLWGSPPNRLKTGMSWEVKIDQPWELGPAGTQHVTVMQLDRQAGIVTLKREGTAVGAFAHEKLQVTLVKDGSRFTFDIVPGQAHWSGYTTFKHGVVQSDELLVVRQDSLHSESTGSIPAVTRRYMLLNAAPYPTIIK